MINIIPEYQQNVDITKLLFTFSYLDQLFRLIYADLCKFFNYISMSWLSGQSLVCP